MKKSTHIPHPFSLAPLFNYPVEFKEGDTFVFKLSLFGNSIIYLPNILHAFITLGEKGIGVKRGKYIITKITDYATNKTLYDGNSLQLSDVQTYSFKELDPEKKEIEITFLTPCKIKSKGQYQKHIELKSIIANIKRKIENISYFFGTNPVILDISEINFNDITCEEKDIQWESTERYSRRKSQRMPLAGFKGKAIIRGNINGIYPLLKIGEAINIGSNASFGFGAIQVR